MIHKDLLKQLTPAQQATMNKVLTSPLVWAETVFPPKMKMEKYQDIDGNWHSQMTVSEGWLTRPWQQEILESPGRRKVVRVSRRAGKMQPLDSIVYTPDGPKTMGEIVAGSVVCTPDGASAKVIDIFPHKNKPIYKLTFTDGTMVEAGLEHLWEVTTANWKYEGRDRKIRDVDTRVVDTQWLIDNLPLQKANRQTISIYATKPVKFSKKNLPIDPYLLGLKRSRSRTKFIPFDYLYSSIEDRLSLLQGLMDTDGSIDKVGRLEYYTTSDQLAKDVISLVQSLGGTARDKVKQPYFTYKGVKKAGKPCHILAIFFDDSIVPFRICRKIERMKLREGTRNDRVKRNLESIEFIGNKDAQCILIDHPSHLYLTDGFVPTHNTLMAIVKCLHMSFVKGRGVLVVAPMERQVAEIYETMHRQFMDPHPEIFTDSSVIKDTRNPYILRFSNGGFINFITAGTKSGGKGESIRGQGHNVGLIYIDEADYLSDDDLDAILAIQIQDNSMEVIMTSTPKGQRKKFYQFCTSPPPGWKAFHKTAWESIPDYNEERDLALKKQYGIDAYNREFMAEFGEEATGVFDKLRIEEAMWRGNDDFPYLDKNNKKISTRWPYFGYPTQVQHDNGVYRIVGVDWDKYGAGTQLLVIEARRAFVGQDAYSQAFSQPFDYIKVIHRREIPKSQFTLTRAVEALVEMNASFSPNFYYLDAGYGEHQIETLQTLGMRCDDPRDPAYGIHKKIRRVNFSEMIDVMDPMTKMIIKRPIKPAMVNHLVNKFDSGEMVLSPFDDLLQKQLENYIVERITAAGAPKYTSVNEHAVDALMLAVWGLYDQFTDKAISRILKGYIDKPLGQRYMEMKEQAGKKEEAILGRRRDYIREQDEVERQNVEEDLAFARSGMLRPDQIQTSPGVPQQANKASFEQTSTFTRGFLPSKRRSF